MHRILNPHNLFFRSSECCEHIGALLFSIADVVSNDRPTLPDHLAILHGSESELEGTGSYILFFYYYYIRCSRLYTPSTLPNEFSRNKLCWEHGSSVQTRNEAFHNKNLKSNKKNKRSDKQKKMNSIKNTTISLSLGQLLLDFKSIFQQNRN